MHTILGVEFTTIVVHYYDIIQILQHYTTTQSLSVWQSVCQSGFTNRQSRQLPGAPPIRSTVVATKRKPRHGICQQKQIKRAPCLFTLPRAPNWQNSHCTLVPTHVQQKLCLLHSSILQKLLVLSSQVSCLVFFQGYQRRQDPNWPGYPLGLHYTSDQREVRVLRAFDFTGGDK